MCQPFGPLRSTQPDQFDLSPAQLLVHTGHLSSWSSVSDILQAAGRRVRAGLAWDI
jgi:hypothetical protein